MTVYMSVFFVAIVCALLPFIFAVVHRVMARDDLIVQINDSQVTVRRYLFEQLFRLSGQKMDCHAIVKIQTAHFPVQGTCISLFNQHDGAIDFWVPDHLVGSLLNKLSSHCPKASVVHY